MTTDTLPENVTENLWLARVSYPDGSAVTSLAAAAHLARSLVAVIETDDSASGLYLVRLPETAEAAFLDAGMIVLDNGQVEVTIEAP